MALAAQPDGPYSADGRGALDKVIAALEPDPRRRESLLATTQLVRTEAGRTAGVRSVVEQGLAGHRVLALRYRDGKGETSRREVEPQLLARTADRSTSWPGAGSGRRSGGSGRTASRARS